MMQYLDPGQTVAHDGDLVQWSAEVSDGGARISHLWVHPDVRGEGRASRVVEGVVNEARAAGLGHVRVRMDGGSQSAKFLRSHGFMVTDRDNGIVHAWKELDNGEFGPI